MSKSYYRGDSSHWTPEVSGSTNADRATKLIEGSEPTKSAPKRFRRVQRPIEFYQPGLDYITYTDAGKLSTYEEVIVALDVDTWLQAMKSEMDSIHKNQTWELV